MTVPSMPVVDLQEPWRLVSRDQERIRARLVVESAQVGAVEVLLSRCLATPLADAYPASTHDVRIEVEPSGLPAAELSRLLRDLVAAVEAGDPSCRRAVYAAPALDLTTVAAAEDAGFRWVVDVDVEDEELSLLVAEPDWVTRVDMDLERVPGS